MQRIRAELALAGVTVIWGTTFVVVKSALADVSTVVFLAMRFCVAALALVLLYKNVLRRQRIGPGILAGTLLFLAYVFQTAGLKLTTPSRSAFLTAMAIPMVPLISSCVYRSKPRGIEIAGILVASAGLILMTWDPGTMSEFRSFMTRGDLLSFLCAVAFAFHIVVIGHYSQQNGFRALAAVQMVTAAALALIFVPWFRSARFHLTPGVVFAVLVTGVLATALAFTTQVWAQQYTSASRAALIFALEPPVAWATSFAVTGEQIVNRGKVGAGMILAGILLVELTKGRLVTISANGTSESSRVENSIRAKQAL